MEKYERSNPYRALGVSRDADDSEIRDAYRKIAKKHHPDVSGCPDDSAEFRAAADAYELLSNTERRCEYDAGVTGYGRSAPGAHSGDFDTIPNPQPRPSRPYGAGYRTLEFAAIVSPGEAAAGGDFNVSIPIPTVCRACRGSFVASLFCDRCHGSGRVETSIPVLLRLPPNISHGTVLTMPLGMHDIAVEITVIIRNSYY